MYKILFGIYVCNKSYYSQGWLPGYSVICKIRLKIERFKRDGDRKREKKTNLKMKRRGGLEVGPGAPCPAGRSIDQTFQQTPNSQHVTGERGQRGPAGTRRLGEGEEGGRGVHRTGLHRSRSDLRPVACFLWPAGPSSLTESQEDCSLEEVSF